MKNNDEKTHVSSTRKSSEMISEFWLKLQRQIAANSIRWNVNKIKQCVSGNSRSILGWIDPMDVDELKTIVRLANQFHISLYPISTGRNWGMGGAMPVVDNCLIVCLKNLNQILSYDEEFGIVEVEPGVTQKQLSDFLLEKKSKYYLDVTGSHHATSIIGNTLERGVAYNSQRITSSLQMKVLLADGNILTTGFNSEDLLSKLYLHGIGPSLNGLFFQSSFGIVTSMVLQLKRYSSFQSFVMIVNDQEELPSVMMQLNILVQKKIITGVPHCFNQLRFCSGLEPLLFQEICNDNAESDIESSDAYHKVKQIINRYAQGAWYIVGKIEGDSKELVLKKSILKSTIAKSKNVKLHITPEWLKKIIMRFAPKDLKYFMKATSLLSGLTIGAPTNLTIHSFYWPSYSKQTLDEQIALQELDKDIDNIQSCVIYGAPILVYSKEMITTVVRILNQFELDHQIRIAMAFNVLSETLLEGVISFHYQQSQAKYYNQKMSELLTLLTKVGVKPYRLSNTTMDMVSDLICPQSQQLIHSIKKVLDPNGIFSPGRYGIHSDNFSH